MYHMSLYEKSYTCKNLSSLDIWAINDTPEGQDQMWLFKNVLTDEFSQCLWFPARLPFILKAIDVAFPRYVPPPLSLKIVLHTPA